MIVRPSVFLVCGLPGAGKTTLTLRLAAEHQAVPFIIDQWGKTLFEPDLIPGNFDNESQFIVWADERAERCRTLIWVIANQVLNVGRSVVLDVATFTRVEREKVRRQAAVMGVDVVLCWATIEETRRWNVVKKRNEERGATYSFVLPQWLYEYQSKHFEEPGPDENPRKYIFGTYS